MESDFTQSGVTLHGHDIGRVGWGLVEGCKVLVEDPQVLSRHLLPRVFDPAKGTGLTRLEGHTILRGVVCGPEMIKVRKSGVCGPQNSEARRNPVWCADLK